MGYSSTLTTLRSGALAKATGVSPDTIRYYESIGVLPKPLRTDSGYRLYPAGAVERVLAVQRALRLGFTLAELAEVLSSRDRGGVPCHRVYELAKEKLRGMEADIEALTYTAQHLRKILADWEDRIQRTGPQQKAHLLYSLSEAADCLEATNYFRGKTRR